MKKKYLLAEFVAVFLILVLPPLFNSSARLPSSAPTMSWTTALLALTAFFFDLQKRFDPEPAVDAPSSKFSLLVRVMAYLAITFGLLMVTYAAFTSLDVFVLHKTTPPAAVVVAPSQWISLLATVLVSAWYEESLYRSFLPETLRTFIDCGGEKMPQTLRSVLTIAAELLVIVVFAFSHRYLGYVAVLNAGICGLFLRICAVRTGGIYTGTAAHFAYNTFIYVLAYTQP